MKWESNIRSLCKKLSRNVYLLSKLSRYASKDALMMFYHAHIMSYVNYASSLWDGSGEVHLKKLNSLHRRAAKIIEKGNNLSTEGKQKKLGMLPLKKQFIYNKAILMYKTFHGDVPKYLSSLFRKAPSRYNSLNFILPYARIDLYQNSLAFSGASTWNSLPANIKDSSSLVTFKKKVFEMLVK